MIVVRRLASFMALHGFPGPGAAGRSARAQGIVTTSRLAMPDGVELATDVWRLPSDVARRPVLLRRTPYGW